MPRVLKCITFVSCLVGVMPLTGCFLCKEENPEAERILAETVYWDTGSSRAVGHQNGDVLVVEEDRVVYAAPNGRYACAELDSSNQVHRVIMNDYIMIFEESSGGLLDIAIIDRGTREIQVLRDVNAQIPEVAQLQNTRVSIAKYVDWHHMELSDALEIGSVAFSGFKCFGAIAAAMSSAGLATPVAFWACGVTLLEFADLFVQDPTLSTAINIAELVVTPDEEALKQAVESLFIATFEYIETSYQEFNQEMALAEGALETGWGQIQITLTWNTTADIDLWVTDPNGERIYYAHPASASGGYLDRDDTNGYGPENVYWENDAISGTYTVQVNHYTGTYPTNYTVLIQQEGYSRTYEGTLSWDETDDVASFVLGDPM